MTIGVQARLEAAGFDRAEVARRATLLQAAVQGLDPHRRPDARLYHVPGRIEVLGKHTDYAGGRSLVAATEQGLATAAAPRADAVVRVLDVASGQRDEFRLDRIEDRRGHWSNYPRVVARRLVRDFPAEWRGMDFAFASDLPPAAGLSSSSALVVATALALGDVNELPDRPAYRAEIRSALDRAAWLGAVENGRPFGALAGGSGVGTLGGNQDQTAILICRAGMLARLRFDPMQIESEVPLPAGLIFAIGVSGVRAEKTGTALDLYNAVASRTRKLWTLVRDTAPAGAQSLGAALLDDPESVGRMRDVLCARVTDAGERTRLTDRLDQLARECLQSIPALEAGLRLGVPAAIAAAAAESHAGAEVALGNQVPETRVLVEEAVTAGAVGASAFGAGFGGSVWALVPREEGREFVERWKASYLRRFPARGAAARFLLTRAAPAAVLVRGPEGDPVPS